MRLDAARSLAVVASPAATVTVPQFQQKWRGVTLKERSASQSHFNDLCHMLGVPTPTDADSTGSFYTFERGAEKTDGGAGWADVWFRGHFAWEYKGQHANLKRAYDQLLQYREDLENLPLLVVCDLDRFEIHTNFTGTVKKVYAFSLADLDQLEHLAVLKALDRSELTPTGHDARSRHEGGRRAFRPPVGQSASARRRPAPSGALSGATAVLSVCRGHRLAAEGAAQGPPG